MQACRHTDKIRRSRKKARLEHISSILTAFVAAVRHAYAGLLQYNGIRHEHKSCID